MDLHAVAGQGGAGCLDERDGAAEPGQALGRLGADRAAAEHEEAVRAVGETEERLNGKRTEDLY
jgi:hypothetical protein